jgi:hypothetical protein
MSGQDLFMELQDKQRLLEKALGELGRRGRSKAEAEQDYRVALAQEMLKKRDAGFPATLIGDLCRGEKHIAKLKFERDVAETMYTAALEAINAYKLSIRVLSDQIDREWSRS